LELTSNFTFKRIGVFYIAVHVYPYLYFVLIDLANLTSH